MVGKAGEPCRTAFALSLAAVILSVFAVAGCAGRDGAREGTPSKAEPETGREIPLMTVAQGVNSEYGRVGDIPMPEDAPPECLVITEAEALQRILSLSSLQEPAGEVDFSRQVVFAAMLGPRNTGGHAISIMRVRQAGTEVLVELELVEPEPGGMTAQILTSPYHLVSAERDAFQPRGELTFAFVDQQDRLISRQQAEL